MRLLLSRGSWLVLLLWTAVIGLPRSDPGNDAAAARIAALVKQLGDDAFAEREAAGAALEAAGEKALPALRKAADASEDAEVRRRAGRLVRAILLGARKSKSTGLELALIDAGEFTMGSPNSEGGRRADELQHRVRLTRPFLLGAFEVTQDQYRQVMGGNPSWFAATGGGKAKVAGLETGRFPVEQVSWYDAVEFCNRLSRQDGYAPYYKLAVEQREAGSIKRASVTAAGGSGYRLPTEAEWECACRAWTDTPYHFGGRNTGREANLKAATFVGGYGAPPTWESLGRTAKVGSYAPNPYGLYDLHGNAAEWCGDWYDRDYYANSPADDPKGPARGNHRVVRGGSWLVDEGSCRCASRNLLSPGESNYYAGFRVARTP
jgi:formylglycine-generating enzyme required for sulfatase activity